ncbi:hypothetical protein Taro_022103 [Colocasia esculenta]|uniref:Uncharacterized protein n=1 Tax=Colocasia esculenta TaxID=4460 RepID=A0A843VAC9_COLES|nr:hypothetical protein [Colocasia esculenta]
MRRHTLPRSGSDKVTIAFMPSFPLGCGRSRVVTRTSGCGRDNALVTTQLATVSLLPSNPGRNQRKKSRSAEGFQLVPSPQRRRGEAKREGLFLRVLSADSAACRLRTLPTHVAAGFCHSFELAVCRLSSLLIHQLSRTLPIQQSGRLSSLPTHVAVLTDNGWSTFWTPGCPRSRQRVERGRNGSWQIFACHMAGIGSHYGALPIDDEELAELAERPGAVTRRRVAAAALTATYGGANASATQMMAITANVITTQGSGGNSEIPSPPEMTPGGTTQEIPLATPLDPAILELLQ